MIALALALLVLSAVPRGAFSRGGLWLSALGVLGVHAATVSLANPSLSADMLGALPLSAPTWTLPLALVSVLSLPANADQRDRLSAAAATWALLTLGHPAALGALALSLWLGQRRAGGALALALLSGLAPPELRSLCLLALAVLVGISEDRAAPVRLATVAAMLATAVVPSGHVALSIALVLSALATRVERPAPLLHLALITLLLGEGSRGAALLAALCALPLASALRGGLLRHALLIPGTLSSCALALALTSASTPAGQLGVLAIIGAALLALRPGPERGFDRVELPAVLASFALGLMPWVALQYMSSMGTLLGGAG